MKSPGLIFLVLLLAASPAWSSKNLTVGQLEDLLRTLHQDKKTDAEVATALKQVRLSQELTRSAMNSMNGYVPGPLTEEQIYVLEARSANLIPPAADLPPAPPPDAQTQQAILAKTANYISNSYNRLPALVATKTTLRFQDNEEAVAASSGLNGSATEVTTSSGFTKPPAFVHLINSTAAQVASEHGAEKPLPEKQKNAWGSNGLIALEEPDPSLGAVFEEARDAGSMQWLRWELVNGKRAAVFSFSVPRKKTHFRVNVCCFPDVTQAGIATFYTSTTAATLGGGSGGGGGGGGVTGNFQTNTNWHNFKATAPYHGEFFIDPQTGVVVRMITEAELKPTEVVHQLNTRIDFGPVNVLGDMLVLPVKTIINSEVVPNGDSGHGGYSTRCTLFTSEYKSYQPAGGKQD